MIVMMKMVNKAMTMAMMMKMAMKMAMTMLRMSLGNFVNLNKGDGRD